MERESLCNYKRPKKKKKNQQRCKKIRRYKKILKVSRKKEREHKTAASWTYQTAKLVQPFLRDIGKWICVELVTNQTRQGQPSVAYHSLHHLKAALTTSCITVLAWNTRQSLGEKKINVLFGCHKMENNFLREAKGTFIYSYDGQSEAMIQGPWTHKLINKQRTFLWIRDLLEYQILKPNESQFSYQASFQPT